jgi:antitoxin FitA
MVTKELLKIEIDRIQDKYLEALYKIIEAFIEATRVNQSAEIVEPDIALSWHDFIEATYGCLADAPIERGDQGVYETREAIG